MVWPGGSASAVAVAPGETGRVCVCVQRWREQLATAVLLLGLVVSPEVTFPACSESQLRAGLQEVLACRHLALPGSLRCPASLASRL